MFNQEQHEMRIETTHESGAEEWLCPTCGRRFLLSWPPAYSKIVLESGDEDVCHTGGKGGLRMGPSQIKDAEEMALADELLLPPVTKFSEVEDEPPLPPITNSFEAEEIGETPITEELRPWLKWMKDAGLDD